MNKTCTKCYTNKPLDEFYESKAYKDGHHSWCKQCAKDRYRKDPIARAKHQKAYRDKYNNSPEFREKCAKYHHVKHIESKKDPVLYEQERKYARDWYLKTKYDLTVAEYNQMLADQNNVCAICGGVNKNGVNLAVDHDHETDEVRGLLCFKCNSVLGKVYDNIDLLHKFIDYLKKYSEVKI